MIDYGKELQNAFDDGYKARDAEIVRCKDCKWWNTDFLPQDCGWCEKDNHGRLADWFCADGEVATVKSGANKDSGDVKQCNR